SGRAAEFESDVPFALVVEALDEHVRSLGETACLSRSETALLAPLFTALDPGGDEISPEGPDEARRLRDALRALLERLASEDPLIIALDDLHWADAASVGFVCNLLHRGLDGPVLILLACRPAQSEARLLSALEQAERHGTARRIEVPALSRTDAAELIGDAIQPALHGPIYRESGGNPFYLEQLLAAAKRGARLTAQDEDADFAGVPPAVSTMIGDEIAALAGRPRSVLDIAAVFGDPFEADLVVDSVNLP